MQYLAELGNGIDMKFYYNEKVYDPHYSSIELAMVANTFIYGPIRLLDVAAGCGFTGLILKKIHPNLQVTLSDISDPACRVARLNSKRLGLPVEVVKSDLIPDDGVSYHVITANLPTFDTEQLKDEELHGPLIAYDGGVKGMELYKRLLKEAKKRCVVLCCEVQEKRQKEFMDLASLNGWKVIEKTTYAFALMDAEEDMNAMIREISAKNIVKSTKKGV